MKRKSIEKVLAVVMAASVAVTPMSSVSFAAEEDAVNANTVTQEVQTSEPAKEQPVEKSAPAANESSAPAASESSAPAVSESSAPAAEESATPADSNASAPAASEAAVPAVEQKQEEAPKPAKSSYKVKIVLEDVMTASGPSSVTAVSSVTIKAGATKTYSATTVNGWIKTKSVKYDSVTYKYASALKDASGNTVTSVTIKAEDLEDDTTLTFRPVYTEVADMHVVVNFNHILQANGQETSSTEQNTLSSGSGWSFTQKKLDNKVVAKSFSYKGVNYKYSGKWVDEDGNEFSSLSIKNNGESKEVVYNISPVYEMSYPEVLDFRYIDNISTGSGSWKNEDAFTTFSHKFKQPAGKEHYKFVEWKNFESNESFQAGDTFKYTAKSNLPEKTVTSINVYAMWQPSVTVEYYSNGVLVKSVESTEGALAAYDYNAADTKESKSGANFIGWYESAEEGAARVEEGTAYELPSVTAEPTEQKIIKLYANYTADYTVEHYTENLDGSFHLASTEEVEGAALGSRVSAEAKEFEGFTFDENIEGTLTEAKAAKGLTLKLYYSRDSYDVTYEYVGDVIPEAAAEQLPETVSYKYGQDVPGADDPQVAGFEFSGWDGEVENMPAENITVTGSWAEAPAAPAADPQAPAKASDKPSHNAVSAANIPAASAQAEQINANAVPQAAAPTVINDNETPLAQTGAWALINLICAAATALLSLIMLAVYFGKRRNEDEQIEDENISKVRIASMIPAIGAIIAFLLTENMSLPMAMVDKWTVLMIAILAIQAGVGIYAKLRDDEGYEKEDESRA